MENISKVRWLTLLAFAVMMSLFLKDYFEHVERCNGLTTIMISGMDSKTIMTNTPRVISEIKYGRKYVKGMMNGPKTATESENKTHVSIDHILNYYKNKKLLRSVKLNAEYLSPEDEYSLSRSNESRQLSNMIQQRFLFLQNPQKCNKAKKIVCDLKHYGGLGATVHHISYCMIMAYATGGTLVLESKGWRYARQGWETLFMPLSQACLDRQGKSTSGWGPHSSIKDIQVIQLPNEAGLPRDSRPDFLPLAIPEDISETLMSMHSNPPAWWVGQVVTFILRPRSHVKEFIMNKTAALGFTHPIVGIQVRRTDKLKKEAEFHGIEGYMMHAIEFYQKLEMKQKGITRRVFLATDDVDLLNEAKKKYPDFVFVSDHTITQSAEVSSRYSKDSLMGIIADLHFLAHSDFLVCAFSSNVCRLAYEMMQHYHTDAGSLVRSVDLPYFYQGQNDPHVVKMPVYNESEFFHL